MVYKGLFCCQDTKASLTRILLHTQSELRHKKPMVELDDIFDERIRAHLSFPDAFVTQQPIALQLEEIRVKGKLLGEGGFGKVYKCQVGKRHFAVKMPSATRVVDGIISSVESSTEEKSLAQFNTEFSNFERMMEPDYVRQKTRPGEHHVALSEESAERNRADYEMLYKEMRTIMGMQGYRNMHRLLHLHVVGSVPLIFSEPCAGSLLDLQAQYRAENQRGLQPQTHNREYVPSPLWASIAKQLTSAMMFMKAREFVNIDIKPGNILYNRTETQEVHCMLSDYDLCRDLATRPYVMEPERLNFGTKMYNAALPVKRGMTAWQLALYQFAATLICLIDYGTMETLFLNFSPQRSRVTHFPELLNSEPALKKLTKRSFHARQFQAGDAFHHLSEIIETSQSNTSSMDPRFNLFRLSSVS